MANGKVDGMMSRNRKWAGGCHCIISRKRVGFTLIELLVVISIVSLLIAILLPALSKVRQTSMRIECAAHFRQMGQLFHVYASQYNDYLPTTYDPSPVSRNWRRILFEVISPRVSQTTSHTVAQEVMQEKVYDMFWCPQFTGLNGKINHGAGRGNSSVNYIFRNAYLRISDLQGQVEPLASDTYPNDLSDPEVGSGFYFQYAFWEPGYSNSRKQKAGDHRHLGSCNVLYLDGHSVSLTMEQSKAIDSLISNNANFK
jgi:prepilin-type N-terminal cleavage/methylation domain-containing protein/prepilin-type processing-associated H-X9-DG protein